MAGIQFFVTDQLTGQQSGPFSFDEIQKQIRDRKLKKSDLVRRAESSQWSTAEQLLAKIFENVDAMKQQQKEQVKAQRSADKEQRRLGKQQEVRQKKQSQRVLANQQVQSKTRLIEANRGSLLGKIFSQMKPSPYWGFEVQGSLINVAIVLVMLAAVVGCIAMVVISGATLFLDSTALSKFFLVLICLVQLIAILVSSFFVVALLVFYRNLIDWMIDMEAHGNALRKHFEG